MQICFECKKIRENVIVSFWRKNRHLFFETVNRYYFNLESAKNLAKKHDEFYEFNSHFKRLEWILISTSEFQKMFIYQATLQYVVLYLDVLCTYQDSWRVSQKILQRFFLTSLNFKVQCSKMNSLQDSSRCTTCGLYENWTHFIDLTLCGTYHKILNARTSLKL